MDSELLGEILIEMVRRTLTINVMGITGREEFANNSDYGGQIGATVRLTPTLLIAPYYGGERFWINGYRSQPNGNFSGWYLWLADKIGEVPRYFGPAGIGELYFLDAALSRFLSLSPGHCFWSDGDFSDIWFDAALCATSNEEPIALRAD